MTDGMSIETYLAAGGILSNPTNVPARYRAELLKLMATRRRQLWRGRLYPGRQPAGDGSAAVLEQRTQIPLGECGARGA